VSPTKTFPTVAVGVSAGGIEALVALFEPMPAELVTPVPS